MLAAIPAPGSDAIAEGRQPWARCLTCAADLFHTAAAVVLLARGPPNACSDAEQLLQQLLGRHFVSNKPCLTLAVPFILGTSIVVLKQLAVFVISTCATCSSKFFGHVSWCPYVQRVRFSSVEALTLESLLHRNLSITSMPYNDFTILTP